MSYPEVYQHSQLEVVPQQTPLPKPYQYSNHNQGLPAPSYDGSYGYQDQGQAPVKEKSICGLRTTTFFLVLALILVILAAGIGGGVGGTMAVNNAKNSAKASNSTITTITTTITAIAASTTSGSASSTSSSAAASSTARVTVPTNGTIALSCPSLNNANLAVSLTTTSTFTVTCGRDFVAINHVTDILAITVYSIDDCAKACASYNRNLGSVGCVAATFNADLSQVPLNFGTCWLKNGTGTVTSSSSNTLAGLLLNQ
ncbi:uncharacterized protein PAC_11106 [Phialocephala subalpina]|uniref:Uncharacterized protein n=1 Tax=Phialocephala subalpina TaxID=576137 RepID=A0A1L7X859_9HELO|nr:uncharacterized protein PAC_11106 [Phialocephala subalpina]